MIKNIFTYLVLILLFVSCKKENRLDCFKSNGNDISESRYFLPFDTLEIFDKFEVTVFKGAEYKIEVIAGKNIIKNISTKLKNRRLIIMNNNTCNFVRGYKRQLKINITVPYIRYIKNNGVGPLRIDEAYVQDTLVVRAESSGDMYLSGSFNQIRTSSHGNGDMIVDATCNSFFVYSNGINFLKAADIKVRDYVFIETLSIGDCDINVDKVKNFEYNIHSSGNIYYHGQAGVITDFSDGQAKGAAIKVD